MARIHLQRACPPQ